ncbi:uncharacterized protein DS421_16g528000 [Arachis hypogaea]|nr:uncharacterized protein DS421_16g528000 [Arachis hypogaea]
MTDHSVTPQANPTNAELLAANAALLAENQRMAELLAAVQNNGNAKNDKKKVDNNEEHQSESNAKTGETPPKT